MAASEVRRRLRSTLTVVAVLLVILAEFVLLTSVYRRPAALHHQRLTESRLAGTLQDARTPTTSVVSEVSQAVRTLHTQGVSAADLAPLRAAAQSLVAEPGSVAALDRVRAADTSLGVTLADDQRTTDDQAEWIYVVLLALASVGWFGWFRRVVRKQRALQRTLTEQTAQAEGAAKLAALVRNASDVIAVVDRDSTISYISPSSLDRARRDARGAARDPLHRPAPSRRHRPLPRGPRHDLARCGASHQRARPPEPVDDQIHAEGVDPQPARGSHRSAGWSSPSAMSPSAARSRSS